MYKGTTSPTAHQADSLRVNIFFWCIISPFLACGPLTRLVVSLLSLMGTSLSLGNKKEVGLSISLATLESLNKLHTREVHRSPLRA